MTMVVSTLPGVRHVASRAVWGNLFGLLAVVGSVAYLAGSLHAGWVPHDTGQMGQTAERVLSGEMQHRDFDEPYTGGLGHLHALAFRLWGVRAESIRWMLLAYFGLFITAVYLIAVRVTSAGFAAAVTFLCASLSLPIYSEGMPSWYNLFFATLGTLALLQHMDTGHRRWLFWAGCCAGCSLLMKITGLYFVAAGLIYIAHHERSLSGTGESRSRGYSVFVTVLCVLFGALSLTFTRGAQPLVHAVHFTLPLVAVAAYVAWQEWRTGRGVWHARARRLVSQLLPYGLGTACVVGLFLVPYVATNTLQDLYRGLFVLPTERLEHAAMSPPDLKWMCLSLPLAALLLVGAFRSASVLNRPAIVVALIATLVAVFYCSGSACGYFYVFQSIRNLIPCVVLVGFGVLFAQPRPPDRQAVCLVLTVTALSSLIQYPYAYGTYFFFAAPLMVLAMLYIVASEPYAPRVLHAAVLAWAICLAVVRIPQPDPRLRERILSSGLSDCGDAAGAMWFPGLSRGCAVYQELVSLDSIAFALRRLHLRRPGLSGSVLPVRRKNPTRTFYDLFDPSTGQVGAHE